MTAAPPPRRDSRRRCRRLLAPDERGRGRDGAVVWEHRKVAPPMTFNATDRYPPMETKPLSR